MKRSLFFIAMACLAAGFSSVCFAQDHATVDSNKLTREQWQSRVNATRERLEERREELRVERERRLGPKREELRLDRENRLGQKQEELRLDREKRIEPKREELRLERENRLGQKQEELRLDREKRSEPKQEELRLDRENRLGQKQEELRLDREERIEPKRDELRRERDEQRERRDFNWSPGIGDPTIGGWVTVVLYLLACLSCWKTAGVVLRDWNGLSDSHVWRAISIAFFFLGINKQLDLQSAMTELGRMVAVTGGWYEQRETVQVYFVLGVAAACVAGTIILLLWTRKSPIQTWLALVGSTFVLGYVLTRAASFHHIDHFIGGRVLGFKWNWILEMTGIAIVLLASKWRRARVFRLLKSNAAP
jgi:hypothetical protein